MQDFPPHGEFGLHPGSLLAIFFGLLVVLVAVLASSALAQGGKHYGQFAPADAYVDGSRLAYYGSEND